MHLIGFIIRIYHDARSSECQILKRVTLSVLEYKFMYEIRMWHNGE
jgi:hypothetical protein